MGAMKINKLEIENVKRVKAVRMKPTPSGLTVIGGNNGQGKTSVLDAIAWALGGEKFRPSMATREGSALPPSLKVVMSNGLVVERTGKNSSLKVTDPSGQKAGQTLLDSFVEKLALDLPRFMEASGKEKAETLLKVIGVGPELEEIERAEKEAYQERLFVGRTADQKEKYAAEQEYYPDAPNELLSPSELLRQQQEILIRNGENQRKRTLARELREQYEKQEAVVQNIGKDLEAARERLIQLKEDLDTAAKSAEDLQDESTEELERNIAEIDEINRKVRANLDKEKAEDDAREYRDKYNRLSQALEDVRNKKKKLLDNAELPLPGLSVQEGELTYKGQKWDNMSGADRLKVSAAIVRKLNPECGFVLMDKLEQMDLDTLTEFNRWLEAEDLQVIATRVSTGGECSIIIEDGCVVDEPVEVPEEKPAAALADWRDF